MKILFSDIYEKSVGLFDDPDITLAYQGNKVQFCKLMYSYLQNSIFAFDNPVKITVRLSNFSSPIGTTEEFDSDGIKKNFEISSEFVLLDNSEYVFKENGKIVEGELDVENRSVTFSNVLEAGGLYSFEQYFVGCFNIDLSDISPSTTVQNTMAVNIKDILARLLVRSWGEKTRNFLLDIENILTDTDFKLHAASPALRAKNEWLKQLEAEISQFKNKLGWVLKFADQMGV